MKRVLVRAGGPLLALSAAYLVVLLFAYVFAVGNIRRHHVESASYLFAAVWLLTTATRPAPQSGATFHSTRRRWIGLALAVATIALYANTLSLGLFSDDFVLARRALDHEWIAQAEFVRPLPLAMWSALLAIDGNPVILHLFSLVLHAVNAVLVYALALRLRVSPSTAAAAGGLFAVFPASVEAVVWPAAVHDLLVGACALSFILLAGGRRSAAGVSAAMLVLIAALLSKESAVAIPLIGAVVWLRRESADDTDARRVLMLGLAVCAVYLVVRTMLVVMPEAFGQRPTRYMLKELIARPIGTLTIPWTTRISESWPWIPFAWAAGSVAAAAIYAWSGRKSVPVGTTIRCLVAAMVAVLPVYSMLFITADLENARYLYLSTAFWAIALCGMVDCVDGFGMVRAFALGVAIVIGAVGVRLHLASWRQAADLRDRVLTAAETTLQTAECTPVSFAGAPDTVHGAYVFRNGLTEALAFRTKARAAAPNRACTFVWNASAFVRATDGGEPIQASVTR